LKIKIEVVVYYFSRQTNDLDPGDLKGLGDSFPLLWLNIEVYLAKI